MNFNTIGIICEYNPFHFGHMYHIKKSKEITGAKNVVCIMSGSMVQRGECAIFDKWERAKRAIEGGADLVVELPVYYALQSAENFAYGAVKILNELGVVDAISFGAETDDISLLKSVAGEITTPSEMYNNTLKENLALGKSYPFACEMALREVLPDVDANIFSPNNTLGISYISSILKIGSNLEPICIKRDNDYHSNCSSDGYMSATAIREKILSKEDYIQWSCDYSDCNIYNLKFAESYILGVLRSINPDSLEDVKGFEDGIANLVVSTAKKVCTIEELFDKCTTKRYTKHRIRRFCICALLGIRGELSPDYVRILAMNKNGTSLIRQIKEKSSLVPITKVADYDGSSMFNLDIAATDFASLCSKEEKLRISGMDYLKSPYVNTDL